MEDNQRSDGTASSPEIIIIENHFYSPTSVKNSRNSIIKKCEEIEPEKTRSTSSIKRRLRNSWNNAKYDNQVSRWMLKRRASFDRYQPLWLLGKMYSLPGNRRTSSISHKSQSQAVDDAYEALYDDFTSRIWFTYRKDFTKLNGCRLKSDCGWGCMLRCGQMLMAQTLLCHVLGRDWTIAADRHDEKSRRWHQKIVECFLDCPKKPFSLHTLVEIGIAYGKRGGDWYGPASTAFILRDALSGCQLPLNADVKRILDDVTIYVAQDGLVYLDELELCTAPSPAASEKSNSSPIVKKAVLLIIPLRLGADEFNPVYIYHLKTVLSMKCCVGVLGGRPKHSMYFVGWQGDALIYLDPHYCQDTVGLDATGSFSLETFHCKWPRKIPFSEIDPSCAVGFYLRPGTHLSDFLAEVIDIVDCSPSGSKAVKYPLFSVMKTKQTVEGRTRPIGNKIKGTPDERIGCVRRSSSASCKLEYVFL